jgi:hypothetical protein
MQCFARLLLCKVPWADFVGMSAVGQASFAHYTAAAQLPQDPAGFLAQQGPAAGSSDSQRPAAIFQAAAEAALPLRVLLEQRRGANVRSFLGLPQLLGGCNEAGGGAAQQPRYLCRAFTFTDDYARCAADMACCALQNQAVVMKARWTAPAAGPNTCCNVYGYGMLDAVMAIPDTSVHLHLTCQHLSLLY